MSNVSIQTWVNIESENYDYFNEFIAGKLEGGMFRAIHEYLRRKLKTSDTAQLTMPYGTYYATMKQQDGTAVADVTWEPSKGFLKLLNDDSDDDSNKSAKFDRNYMDEFDPEYVKLFVDYLAYGMFDPTEEDKSDESKRQLYLDDAEVVYFLNSYVLVLYNVAKDKQRDGKAYRLEIDGECPHGSFDFLYKGDKIEVKFIPNKVFKQSLKDDKMAEKVNKGDFRAVTDITKEFTPAA